MNKTNVKINEIILNENTKGFKRNSFVKLFFIWLLICSPLLLLGNILGLASVALWLANTAIMTLIARYVMTRKRGDEDSWDGV
ncbi:hypothetical protein [Serratia rubidaea]|uniref:hypothetical protein n=1 Tax=Serratia rubidaea TaxID=61652 RepID=UPI00177FDB6C|nr:hypothetical protein [Serratia rubidaea]MBD8451854.1 hypothetical protein [Serratia rubidaea]